MFVKARWHLRSLAAKDATLSARSDLWSRALAGGGGGRDEGDEAELRPAGAQAAVPSEGQRHSVHGRASGGGADGRPQHPSTHARLGHVGF